MNLWKKLTATAVAAVMGAAVLAAPASAQTRYRVVRMNSAQVHRMAVMNAHKATRAARMGHPMMSKRYAALAQREYNIAYRMRTHNNMVRTRRSMR